MKGREKGVFWGVLVVAPLGLASDFLCVLVEGIYCIAISAVGGIVAVAFGKSLGSVPTLMHAALLRYRTWIFWHMYRACVVVFSVDDEFHREPT